MKPMLIEMIMLLLLVLLVGCTRGRGEQSRDLARPMGLEMSSELKSYVSDYVDRKKRGEEGKGRRSCIILSWAQTKDGKLCFEDRGREVKRRRMRANVMLSGEESLRFTHSFLRSIADYIMVGSGTILVDDPRLVEHEDGKEGGEGLKPVVLVGWKTWEKELEGRWDGLRLERKWDGAVVFIGGDGGDGGGEGDGEESVVREEREGGEWRVLARRTKGRWKGRNVREVLGRLKGREHGVVVIVEGGVTVLQQLLDEGCWDLICITKCPRTGEEVDRSLGKGFKVDFDFDEGGEGRSFQVGEDVIQVISRL
ncbi:hypothetical protein TrLO_g13331 [Triparma laevis f. longispina]|uniref:Bacterial bifunctional deaminase-reductase C-terminal domain-containing protein n=1 Tax=Triparma laevis f. longispina TaxID=1714387 RepID=A0A9W7L0I3_9STRA|nr:hypothetical protein TrLO_g13331 [Triparma laevis f. longispina]